MMHLTFKCFLLFFFCANEGFSQHDAVQSDQNLTRREKRQSKATRPTLKVTDYHVKCSVTSRYVVTEVRSSVWNQMAVTKEAVFEVDLPSSAFISNFSIVTNGKVYDAQVKERAAARKIYEAAKKQGKAAGLVATKERETEKFRVAVSVPPGARVSFALTYEELLHRRLGRYRVSAPLRAGQPVQNLTVEVALAEPTGIRFLKVLPLGSGGSPSSNRTQAPASTRVEQNAGCARVSYSPTLEQQVHVSPKGLNGDLVVQYDVNMTDPMGDVRVFDGYFVHYFAPRGLPVVPKDVVFVIDVSGSMIGTKIKQTKQAMNTILGELREGDHFNIVTFSDKVDVWKKGRTVPASRRNVQDAKEFVKKIVAQGWTNINAALLSAARLVKPPPAPSGSPRVPLLVFLTDGEATTGVTAGGAILTNAKKALGTVSLFGLAFGDDADFPLLRRLALENRGAARMVYEDADAASQLKGFYDEVASPLLADVQLRYLDGRAFDVTRALFPNYFRGSELVVAGRLGREAGPGDFQVSLSATDWQRRIRLEGRVPVDAGRPSPDCPWPPEGMSGFVRRLWAFSTIKELLQAKLNAADADIQKVLEGKATKLSLEYNFVTPVTSLVVVKPDAERVAPSPATVRTAVPVPVPTPVPTETQSPTAKTLKTTTSSPAHSRPTPLLTHTKLWQNATENVGKGHESPPRFTKTSPLPTLASPAAMATMVPSTAPQPIRPASEESEANVGTTPGPDVLPAPFPVVAKLVSANFAPMPGATDAPKLWEAAGLLDVSTSIQIQRKDLDAAKDYDVTYEYDDDDDDNLNRDAWVNAADTESFEPPTGLSAEHFSSSADGDPHFVLQLPKQKQNLCFTVNGRANDVLRLVDDPQRGVTVDGHLTGAPSKRGHENSWRTYFDWLSVTAGRVEIAVSLDHVSVRGEGRDRLRLDRSASLTRGGVTVGVDERRGCRIQLAEDVHFLVLFHRYKHPSYLQMDHLGFYITRGRGLSPFTRGLLGQFQHAALSVAATKDGGGDGTAGRGVLRRGSQLMPVTLQDKMLKDSALRRHVDKCWAVPKSEIERLLGRPYASYVVRRH
ncbi:inter-alpha-trypsin inhibitor heavy chain H6 [Stigmatopora argus]